MAKNKFPFLFIIIVAVIFIVFVTTYFSVLIQENEDIAELSVIEIDNEDTTKSKVEIDVEAALSDRIMGNSNSPIKISEHSSFACGYCGVFHETTLKELKEKYIDTGKAYFIFSDFPLNAPALRASMVARCLPNDKYFNFIEMLFKTQNVWAYERNYLELLQIKALEFGLNEDTFKACISNEELQNGIIARQKASQEQWEINSTPSFVINNKTVIVGAYPFEKFEKFMTDAITKQEGSIP
ncbi:MAG: thioredoxin domain-containing protein [Alphaproteobacteria bacterium]|nr:thioredoxin domain-containing protein [Alphaproteobacteria bacterium]